MNDKELERELYKKYTTNILGDISTEWVDALEEQRKKAKREVKRRREDGIFLIPFKKV